MNKLNSLEPYSNVLITYWKGTEDAFSKVATYLGYKNNLYHFKDEDGDFSFSKDFLSNISTNGVYISTLALLEKKGEVTFYNDINTNKLYYTFGDSHKLFKVYNGKIKYKNILTNKGYDIKYNTNGVYGFAIFKGSTCLESGYWTIDGARKYIDSISV